MRFGRLTRTLAVSYAVLRYNSLFTLIYLHRFLSTNPLPGLCFRLRGTQHCHGHVPSLNPAPPSLDCEPQPETKDTSHGPLLRRCIRHDSRNHPSCYYYEGTSHAMIIYIRIHTSLLRVVADTYYRTAPMVPRLARSGPVERLSSQSLSPTCPSSSHLSAKVSGRSVSPTSSVPQGKHQDSHTSSPVEV